MASRLHWADYLIFVVFLVISLAIGIYHSLTGGRQKTIAEFIMGNRRLKVIPTAISMLVSYQSTVLLLGHPAEIYSYGIQFVLFVIVTNTIVYVIVERIVVPWLYPLKLVSVYDYLERRYMSKVIRICGATVGILVGVLYTGAVIYAPSAALESATGLPLSVSVPVMTFVTVAYTVLGGMRAVIWTDVFQFLIMIGGMTAILVKGLILVGGIGNVFRLAGDEGRLVWANVSLDPRERHTVWNILIGTGINLTATYGLSQAPFQRYCAVDKLAKARTMVLLNIPPAIIMYAMMGVIGLIVLAYYSSVKCDPLANGDISNPNMLLPYFVVTIFSDSPGFSGLFLATLYGAALSTVSSSLSAAATNCWEDMFKWKLDHLPEARKVLINRLLIMLFGAIATGVAFLTASVEIPILQVIIAVTSSLIGPITTVFVLGAISKHANWKGTLLGFIVGVSIIFWLSTMSMKVGRIHPPLPPMSVERCSTGIGNSTLFHSSSNSASYTTKSIDGIDARDSWNRTSAGVGHAKQLRGLENLYAMSYLWYPPLAVIVTGVVSIVASFIMRDRDLEAKVDDSLLLRFNFWSWSDESADQKHRLREENNTAQQETKSLKEPDEDVPNDVEMTDSKSTRNRVGSETKDDTRKKTENDSVDSYDAGERSCVKIYSSSSI